MNDQLGVVDDQLDNQFVVANDHWDIAEHQFDVAGDQFND